jgi:hypothetical protein
MKYLCEFMSEGCAAAAAVLWFASASIRLQKRNTFRRGLESGFDDPKALLIMVYKQSRWSAWAAIAAGLAAVFAIADGLLPGTEQQCFSFHALHATTHVLKREQRPFEHRTDRSSR